MKGTQKVSIPDSSSGVSTLLVDGDSLLVASNFYVFPMNKKGKIAWESVNKKGGLYPSQARGLRYLKGFPVRKSYGDLVATDGTRIWVAADNGHDVLTVLDRASGAYIETLDVNLGIVSLAVVGDRLAVATGQDLRFLPVGQ